MNRPYAEVIGDPIGHSKSPLIHTFWLEKLGIHADYRAFHVRPDDLQDYFTQRRENANWRGCNVTIPHKERVGRYLDRMDGSATAVGAVNTAYRDGAMSIGTNTDVIGVEEALAGLDLTARPVCVIGNGGAARAAFAALARGGAGAVRVLARNPEKAAPVATSFGLNARAVRLEDGGRALDQAGLLINATQLGMAGQAPMPASILQELSGLASGALVFDMVYAPLETELLAAARRSGLATADGLTMLIGQAAAAFAKFFGQPAPREHDAELRALLTA